MVGFWVGYAAMQLPAGWLVTRWRPRTVVGLGLAGSSLLCVPKLPRRLHAVLQRLAVRYKSV